MAFPILTLPQFPNVPSAPGIPPMVRSSLFPPTDTPPPLIGDATTVASSMTAPKWGIFDAFGVPVVTFDTFVSFEYTGDMNDANFPLEQGAFETYNKVAEPFDARVVLTKGGSLSDRTAFVSQLEMARTSLDLFNIFTPERTYRNVNVNHVDYLRNSNKGVSLITADIHLTEIRITSPAQYSNTAASSGANAQSGGTVQAQPPTAPQAAAPRVII